MQNETLHEKIVFDVVRLSFFLMGIGGKLPDGTVHDGRAPDYDDWISEAGDGHQGLNGDLLVDGNVNSMNLPPYNSMKVVKSNNQTSGVVENLFDNIFLMNS